LEEDVMFEPGEPDEIRIKVGVFFSLAKVAIAEVAVCTTSISVCRRFTLARGVLNTFAGD
jgi:hypothetical protein